MWIAYAPLIAFSTLLSMYHTFVDTFSYLILFHRLYSHTKTGNWIQSGWIWIALCCTSVLLLHRTWLSSNFHDSQYVHVWYWQRLWFFSTKKKIYKINNPFDLERVLCDFNDELNHERMRSISTCFSSQKYLIPKSIHF